MRVGSSREALYDGEEFAKKGVVVVTLNYRLGIFGFFAYPELTKESAHHASGLSAADHKIVCDFEEGCTWLESQVRSKTATRAFPLEGKLLGCFCEVRFPLFSYWPSVRIVLGNTVVRSENYWRFISGFCPIRSNPGRSGQMVHHMKTVQCRINTGYFASR
jgi:hypothetical protein